MRGCRPLTKHEEAQLVATFKGKYKERNTALLSMGIRTGFRVTELLSLNVGDVFQNGRVADAVSVKRAVMKGGYEGRTVMLNEKAKEDVTAWLNILWGWGCSPETPLFCTSTKRRLCRSSVRKMISKRAAKLGLTGKLGTHCMRKTFADRVYEGVDGRLVDLQAALGHKWITSTAKYVSFRNDKVNAAIGAI